MREIRYHSGLEPVERRVAVRVRSRWVIRTASEVEEEEQERVTSVLKKTKKGGREEEDDGEEGEDDDKEGEEGEDDDGEDDDDDNGGDNDEDGDPGFDQAATSASKWIKSPSRLDAIAQRWRERLLRNTEAQHAEIAAITDQWTSALEDIERRRNERLRREQEANQASPPPPPPTRSSSLPGRPAQVDAFGNPVPPRHTNTPVPPSTTSDAPTPTSSTLEAIRVSDGRRYTVTMEIDGVNLTTPFTARRGTGQDEGMIVLTPVDNQEQAPSDREPILETEKGMI